MTAKTRAIPSLHRDSFLSKENRTWPVPASGNTTSPYCRAVIGNAPCNSNDNNTETDFYSIDENADKLVPKR